MLYQNESHELFLHFLRDAMREYTISPWNITKEIIFLCYTWIVVHVGVVCGRILIINWLARFVLFLAALGQDGEYICMHCESAVAKFYVCTRLFQTRNTIWIQLLHTNPQQLIWCNIQLKNGRFHETFFCTSTTSSMRQASKSLRELQIVSVRIMSTNQLPIYVNLFQK